MMYVKIQTVHKRLDAFELRVSKRPPPTIDVTTLQQELARLCDDVDALLTPLEMVPETTPDDKVDNVVITTLFGYTGPPPDPSRVARKCHRSSVQTANAEETRRAKKRERQLI
uniref:Integrase core domain containing protein n=1 Tax=Solanum tuberosum TaxID=4113 RepID=M1DV57_SOLTU